eukprot:gene18126-19936_t
MEIQTVDSLVLEAFNLHGAEPICHHSPSDYLSTNFKFYDETDHNGIDTNESSSSHAVKASSTEHSTATDVDVLWTKAVDNMFKSSRLFNGSSSDGGLVVLADEEKENLGENIMIGENSVVPSSSETDVGVKQEIGIDCGFDKEREAKKEDQILPDNGGTASTKEVKSATMIGASKEYGAIDDTKACVMESIASTDQIVPPSPHSSPILSSSHNLSSSSSYPTKPVKKQLTSLKRKHQDLDVNFDLLVSSSFPPSLRYENKRPRLDVNMNGRRFDTHDVWTFPPKNCIAVDYSFDTGARLPSFREAFVPAIKKLSLKTKELKRENKTNRQLIHKRQVAVAAPKVHSKSEEETPVHNQSGIELENQKIRGCTGGALQGSVTHTAALLSEASEAGTFGSTNKTHAKYQCSLNSNTGHSSPPQLNQQTSKHFHQSTIKLEKIDDDFSTSCDKRFHEDDAPAKFLGLNSANLKDIEKDIFSFDEGLEMLDLDKDFSLQNITTSAIMDVVSCGVSNVLSSHDDDWSFGLTHDMNGEKMTAERAHNNDKVLQQHDNAPVSGNTSQLPIASNTQANGLAAPFVQSNPAPNGMDMINIGQHGMQMNIMKQERPVVHHSEQVNFDVLCHMQQPMQQSMQHAMQQPMQQPIQHNDLQDNQNNIMFNKDFPPDINTHASHAVARSPPSTLNGQIIAQQIHQSFGTDVFGAPGDNGAKILAKYLAQRGSMRPGIEKPNIDVTSAIASLIGKSFDEQEANHKVARDNSTVDFISTSDLEHLDFMNEQF